MPKDQNILQKTKEIAHQYADVLVKVSTPFGVGSGFILGDEGLIVTNEHVVRGHKSVVIEGKNFKKQMTDVLFIDQTFDLAFLASVRDLKPRLVNVKSTIDTEEGEHVLALGHPFDLRYTVTQGIVSNTTYFDNHIRYIQHDAALNPGNSGGPLLDKEGHIIGVNSFIFREGQNMGFALASPHLLACLSEFKTGHGKPGVRCTSCLNICFEDKINHISHCPHCGARLEYISQLENYQPTGIPMLIENTISDLGYDVPLVRQGMNQWVLEKGSSALHLSYFEKNGLVIADVYLCLLPKKDLDQIYAYMLLQNNLLEGISFSLKNQNIILSMVIHDQYIQIKTLKKMIENLLQQADKYDDIFIDEFGATWIEKN